MPLLTTKEAAKLLSVHPKHIYRLMKQGLPAARVGSEWRFETDALMRWTRGEKIRVTGSETPPKSSADPTGAPRLENTAPPPLIATNDDLLIDELLAVLQAEGELVLGFVLADQGQARTHLLENRVLFASAHENARGRTSPAPKLARLHLATREIGLATASPKPIRGLSQIAGKRLALWPESSAVRVLLDQALAREAVSKERAYRRAREYSSHREVVLALATGQADGGLTTHAWANAAHLSFYPIGSESFELSVRIDCLSDPRVVRVLEIVQGASFRRALRDRHGYGVERTGELKFT